MRTDGVFNTRYIKINHKFGTPLKLIPFGDIHHDSPAFSHDAFQKFIDYAKRQKNVMFLGMGDYFDSFSTSERVIMSNHGLHESTRKRNEKEADGRIQQLADKLQFMRGKVIGLIGGNHFIEFADGTTSDMRLAEKLGTSYLGSCCAIRLCFKQGSHNAGVVCDIFAHHGRGGGVTAGGRYNAVEKLANVCEADIFLMGDNHARGCFPMGDRLYLTTNGRGAHIRSKTRWLGRTGSFLRGYLPGESSYVVDRALPPANLGWIEFEIIPTRRQDNYMDWQGLEIKAHQ